MRNTHERALDGFDACFRIIRTSRLYAIFDRCGRTICNSAERSLTWAVIAPLATSFAALPSRERLRWAATAIAAAALTHAVALAMVPPRVRPVVPRVFWVAVGIVAAAAAIRWAGGTPRDQTSDEYDSSRSSNQAT